MTENATLDGPAAVVVLVFIFLALVGGGVVLLTRLGPFLESLTDKWEQEIYQRGWDEAGRNDR